MAYRRRYNKRKAPARAKKMYKKRKIARKSRYVVHNFKRFCDDVHLVNTGTTTFDLNLVVNGNNVGKSFNGISVSNLYSSVNTTSAVGMAMGFQFRDITNFQELVPVFDKYKITGCKIQIIPMSNTARANNLDTLGTLTYCFDQDSAVAPTDQSTLRQYHNAKVRRLDKPLSMYYRPTLLGQISDGAIGTSNSVIKSRYIDMSDQAVNHYGLKLWFDELQLGSTASNNTIFKIVRKYYFKCANPI